MAVSAVRWKAAPSLAAAVALQISLLLLSEPLPTSGQTAPAHAKAYPLSTWSNMTCRAKGRFQDRGYCASAVIDQIVVDGKSAISVLISQITDARLIAEPVYDFWPRIRAGELAYFILSDLFCRRFLAEKHHARSVPPSEVRRTLVGVLGEVSEDT